MSRGRGAGRLRTKGSVVLQAVALLAGVGLSMTAAATEPGAVSRAVEVAPPPGWNPDAPLFMDETPPVKRPVERAGDQAAGRPGAAPIQRSVERQTERHTERQVERHTERASAREAVESVRHTEAPSSRRAAASSSESRTASAQPAQGPLKAAGRPVPPSSGQRSAGGRPAVTAVAATQDGSSASARHRRIDPPAGTARGGQGGAAKRPAVDRADKALAKPGKQGGARHAAAGSASPRQAGAGKAAPLKARPDPTSPGKAGAMAKAQAPRSTGRPGSPGAATPRPSGKTAVRDTARTGLSKPRPATAAPGRSGEGPQARQRLASIPAKPADRSVTRTGASPQAKPTGAGKPQVAGKPTGQTGPRSSSGAAAARGTPPGASRETRAPHANARPARGG